MKLIDMDIKEYLEVLKSSAPAPGGGSVSALSGAQGAALIVMVTELTLGKEKYADYQDVCEKTKSEAVTLYEKLVQAIDKDTEAYNRVALAFKMPKDSDAEKADRSLAIAEATLMATQVPYETLELCLEGIKVAEQIIGKSNPNAASDIGTGALSFVAGARGAWLNVKINLPGIKDPEKKAFYAEQGAKLLKEAEEKAEKIYQAVLGSL